MLAKQCVSLDVQQCERIEHLQHQEVMVDHVQTGLATPVTNSHRGVALDELTSLNAMETTTNSQGLHNRKKQIITEARRILSHVPHHSGTTT